MQIKSVFREGFGLTRAVVERVEFDETEGVFVVSARPQAGARNRCGHCGKRSPRYDHGNGRRRWRALDLGTIPVQIEAAAPRVTCATHGPTVAQVPWARHGAGHTRDFDDYAAWLAVHLSKSGVVEVLRVAWRTVGSILTRVGADIEARIDRLAGLRRMGIDEISYKRGHRYLTVVVNHDTGALVWAAPGREQATIRRFFDDLGPVRAAQITHVSADMASAIAVVVAERAPQAIRCADPFHIVVWAGDALDIERRRAWNEAAGRRRGTTPTGFRTGGTGDARTFKMARWALWRANENLSDHQREQLAWIKQTDDRLWRAYRLKEELRLVFQLQGDAAKAALNEWIQWARRCRIPSFVQLQRRIVRNRAAIDATLDCGLSNALVESTNTKIRLLTRIAFGFHSPQPLIALALLALGSERPTLPGRNDPRK